MRKINYRGIIYVEAGDATYTPRSMRDNGPVVERMGKILDALILRHFKKAREYGLALKKNPKDELAYRNWRERVRFVKLFEALKEYIGKEPDLATKVGDYLKAQTQESFAKYWDALKEHGLDKVEPIPDDFKWPTAERNSEPALSVIPSQSLNRLAR